MDQDIDVMDGAFHVRLTVKQQTLKGIPGAREAGPPFDPA